jgi:hypothetical protein
MHIIFPVFIIITVLIILSPLSHEVSPSSPNVLNKTRGLQLLASLVDSDSDAATNFFLDKSTQFQYEGQIEGVISPFNINGRIIHPYAYSYKKVNVQKIIENRDTETIVPFSGMPQMQLEITVAKGIADNEKWMDITNAQQGSYQSEDSLDVNSRVAFFSDLNPTRLTIALDNAGLLALDNAPISLSEVKSHSSIKYTGKNINDIERSSNSIGAEAVASAALTSGGTQIGSINNKILLDKKQLKSTNTEFLFNNELTKESNIDLRSGIYLTTDSLLAPTYNKLGINSSLDYDLNSHSTGVADIGYAQLQTSMPGKIADMQRPANEGRDRYVGNFDITRKIHMNSSAWKIEYDDDWLPCCYGGYLTMPTYYQKGSKGFGGNVKNVFDCTCWR